ncbi:MAG TPA: S1 RNA-binding domain-containing protein, partial [Candidatus Korarchaeota archaeon]|nr:S1 RNA-binding domain-containing protein [Candidatus Korarchaeota archaeon]
VRVGPVDGFIHISQLGDDVFIQRGGVLQGRKTKITYRPGDRIRARVTAVSKPDPTAPKRGEPIIRIALSCRQPGLGKIEEKEEEESAKT